MAVLLSLNGPLVVFLSYIAMSATSTLSFLKAVTEGYSAAVHCLVTAGADPYIPNLCNNYSLAIQVVILTTSILLRDLTPSCVTLSTAGTSSIRKIQQSAWLAHGTQAIFSLARQTPWRSSKCAMKTSSTCRRVDVCHPVHTQT